MCYLYRRTRRICIWVGFSSVGNDAVNTPITARSRQPGYPFLFSGDRHGWRSNWIMCAGWRTFSPHTGNHSLTYCSACLIRHPRCSYMVYPLLSLEVVTRRDKTPRHNSALSFTRKKIHLMNSSQKDATYPQIRFAATPHGASCFVQATPAW